MRGIITHIQRMSIHDGPGIRSTIFMKGCNLHCQWCHNPETFSSSPEIEWIQDKCISCSACVDVCQPKALYLDNGKVAFDKSKCTACFDCIPVCFPEALVKIGREVTPQEVFSQVKQDFSYFKESKGGVTISGGEPMLQPEFVKETFALFQSAGIHTALESNMSLPWKQYEAVLPHINLVMVDIKLMNSNLHKKWTGSSNKRILENIIALDATGKPYILRTPVVPDANADEESIREISDFLAQLKNLVKFELLAFHPLAATKYKNLGIPNPFEGKRGITHEEIKKYNNLFLRDLPL